MNLENTTGDCENDESLCSTYPKNYCLCIFHINSQNHLQHRSRVPMPRATSLTAVASNLLVRSLGAIRTLVASPGHGLQVTRSRGGTGHRTLRRTHTSKQAGKALRSQGLPHAHVM